MSFAGTFDHTVDPKGRLVVPSRYRDDFRDGGHLSLRHDHIALYDPAGWQRFLDRLRQDYNDGHFDRDEFNQILALSADVTPDGQGRFGITPKLRELAEIDVESKVVVVGVDDYLGIYRPDRAPVPEAPALASLLDKLAARPL